MFIYIFLLYNIVEYGGTSYKDLLTNGAKWFLTLAPRYHPKKATI